MAKYMYATMPKTIKAIIGIYLFDVMHIFDNTEGLLEFVCDLELLTLSEYLAFVSSLLLICGNCPFLFFFLDILLTFE